MKVFRARPVKLLQIVCQGLVFLAFFLATILAPFIPAFKAPPHVWPATTVLSLLWLTMLAITVGVLVLNSAPIEVNLTGIRRKTLFGSQEVPWSEIETVDSDLIKQRSLILRLHGGKTMSISTQILEDPQGLLEAIQNGMKGSSPRETPTDFAKSGGAFAFAIVLFAMVVFAGIAISAAENSGWHDVKPIVLTLVGLFALILFLLALGFSYRYHLTKTGFERSSLFGKRYVDFESIESIQLSLRYTKAGIMEQMKLDTARGSFYIASGTDNFAILRDAIIAGANRARVVDLRPQEAR